MHEPTEAQSGKAAYREPHSLEMAKLADSRVDFLTFNLKLEAAHVGDREVSWKDPPNPRGPSLGPPPPPLGSQLRVHQAPRRFSVTSRSSAPLPPVGTGAGAAGTEERWYSMQIGPLKFHADSEIQC